MYDVATSPSFWGDVSKVQGGRVFRPGQPGMQFTYPKVVYVNDKSLGAGNFVYTARKAPWFRVINNDVSHFGQWIGISVPGSVSGGYNGEVKQRYRIWTSVTVKCKGATMF